VTLASISIRVGPSIDHYAIHVVRDGYHNRFRTRAVAFGSNGSLTDGVSAVRTDWFVGTVGHPGGDRVRIVPDRPRAIELYAAEVNRLREAGGQPLGDHELPDEDTIAGIAAMEKMGPVDVTCALPHRPDAPSLRLVVGPSDTRLHPGAPLSVYPLLRAGASAAAGQVASLLPHCFERFGIAHLVIDGYLIGGPRRIAAVGVVALTFAGDHEVVSITDLAEQRELAALVAGMPEAAGRLQIASLRHP
jgi:hypothetical protein